ncbi:MAG: NUDIX domain-containing protein [Acidimicrobiales bacterium]|jgi:ADP-ribose pyrophosphatase YjhB (NUDIX family)
MKPARTGTDEPRAPARELRSAVPGGGPPLSEEEFHAIYSRVPRLTVEVIVQSRRGVLLTKRATGPCTGLWHIPGGTVQFGERLVAAVERVAGVELGLEVSVGPFLGYIEYPSHYLNGLDSPVGLAFVVHVGEDQLTSLADQPSWFAALPDQMHREQRDFLLEHGLVRS